MLFIKDGMHKEVTCHIKKKKVIKIYVRGKRYKLVVIQCVYNLSISISEFTVK